ncbi:MAG: type I addiction module toxin, SymE family [Lachnospiraceae bacterium]|nr:type I addiction module toxin, SymE family [Lachnospiraceae bacterium]
MSFKRFRSMKAIRQSVRNYMDALTIILKSRWLEELGFCIGDYVSVCCEK